jgi:K+-transporting ATPase KdpF subunit
VCPLRGGLRKDLTMAETIGLLVGVALIVYLFAAVIRPEKL